MRTPIRNNNNNIITASATEFIYLVYTRVVPTFRVVNVVCSIVTGDLRTILVGMWYYLFIFSPFLYFTTVNIINVPAPRPPFTLIPTKIKEIYIT